MEQIVDGVYALSLDFEHDGRERILWPTIFETEDGILLIDTGLPSHFEALSGELEACGFGVEDVQFVLLTHRDVDHAGTLKYVTEKTDAIVFAHTDEAAAIAENSAPVDVELVDEERIRTKAGKLEIVATPGHTSGHISLYCPEKKLLVAADALSGEDGFGGPRPDVSDNMAMVTNSVKRLAGLDVECTICYHGGPIKHDPDEIQVIYDTMK